MAMTPQQRTQAALKAAATRRANRANGIPPNSRPTTTSAPRAARGPLFPPQASAHQLLCEALVKLEAAMVAKHGTKPPADVEEAFTKYQKCKALALHATTLTTEAAVALRAAAIAAIKLAI